MLIYSVDRLASSYNNIDIIIKSAGKPLQILPLGELQNGGSDWTSGSKGYLVCKQDEEFTVEVDASRYMRRIMPNDQYKDVQGVLSIDGREQGKRQTSGYRGNGSLRWKESRVNDRITRPFVFSAPELTDEPRLMMSELQEKQAGVIRIDFYRLQVFPGTKQLPTTTFRRPMQEISNSKLNERNKQSPFVTITKLGRPIEAPINRSGMGRPQSMRAPRDAYICSIELYPQTREVLQAQGYMAKHQEQPVVKNGCSVETKPEVDIVKQEVQENLVGPSVTEVRPRVLRGEDRIDSENESYESSYVSYLQQQITLLRNMPPPMEDPNKVAQREMTHMLKLAAERDGGFVDLT